MNNVEKIQDAEAAVERLQVALDSVQSGLQRAEELAVAAEEAKARSEQALKAVAVVSVLSLLALAIALRRRR